MEDLDKEAYERRKRDQLEYRAKKRTSSIFMLAATAFEIVETLIIMLALFLLDAFILLKVCNPESATVQIIFQITTIIIFLGGIVLGFLLYKKIIRWVIIKFNLKDKLMDEVTSHYIKPTEGEMEEKLKR